MGAVLQLNTTFSQSIYAERKRRIYSRMILERKRRHKKNRRAVEPIKGKYKWQLHLRCLVFTCTNRVFHTCARSCIMRAAESYYAPRPSYPVYSRVSAFARSAAEFFHGWNHIPLCHPRFHRAKLRRRI